MSIKLWLGMVAEREREREEGEMLDGVIIWWRALIRHTHTEYTAGM